MSNILGLDAISHRAHAPKAAARTSNLSGYATTAMWFTGLLTALMGVSALLSLARLF